MNGEAHQQQSLFFANILEILQQIVLELFAEDFFKILNGNKIFL